MLASLAIALTVKSASEVEEFFPLDTGRTWTYSDNGTLGGMDRASAPQKVGDAPATPIVTVIDGKVDGSTFYRIEGDQVLVVAFEQNKPLEAPYPILQLGKGKNTWNYAGATQWLGGPAPMTIKGSTKRAGSREVAGVKRDVIEVTLEAVIGEESGVNVKSRQVSIYARGVGLIELTDRTTMKKTTTERKRKLISFTTGNQE